MLLVLTNISTASWHKIKSWLKLVHQTGLAKQETYPALVDTIMERLHSREHITELRLRDTQLCVVCD